MAGRYDLAIRRGSVLRRRFAYRDSARQPVDLTGWRAELLYSRSGRPAALASTEDGRLAVAADGSITLTLGATVTASLQPNLRTTYELKLTPPGDAEGAYALLEGTLST